MRAPVNGTEIAYRLDGPENAPVVVLSHSLSTTMEMWRGQVPMLAAKYRVLRYDMRGHGESAAPQGSYNFDMLAKDVVGLLDHLKIERAAFVGISIGGMIGQGLGINHGSRLSGLVLANTTSEPPPKEMWDERIAQVEKGGMESQVQSTLGRWFTEPYRRGNPAVMEWIAGMIRNTPTAGLIGCGRAIQSLGYANHLRKITAPTLVIAGDQDLGTTPAMGKVIAGRIPQAQFRVIKGASHISAVEKEAEFNDLLSIQFSAILSDT
ncbi:MAG TPA: 3-oxoadipate enol-lactonase [Verrucomicrobiae bacterium]|nr:3-oxoadipate enol-lactonase [Verrucomicrobiae bacterium]